MENTDNKIKTQEKFAILVDEILNKPGAEVETADMEQFVNNISTTQEIGDILPVVKSYMDKYKESVDACDGMVQKWNLSKTMWKERAEKLGTIMEKLMTNAGIKKWISDGITASLTTRTNLEVIDPEVLLAPFRPMIQQLAVSLPPYVKVDIKLGKKELSTIVKTDNTLLLSDPENIHYKDSVTFGLK